MAKIVKSSRLKDVQATCVAYDKNNGNVILPGRRAFTFVPLAGIEYPAPYRYTLRHAAVADATRIYCNPETPSLFAIARGSSLELFEFTKGSTQSNTEICSKKLDIQAHTKAIDDFSWCPIASNWLVSCSRDQYAVLWDVTRSEAVANFRATSPFSCCCWLLAGKSSSLSSPSTSGQQTLQQHSPPSFANLSGYVVVTTADSRLLFWDVRAGSRPAIVVQAHALRIHALDAGTANDEQYQLVTAADGDSRVSLWDVRNLDRKLSSIESPFGQQPPRRLRFSPSGGMLLATASTMPRPASIDEPRAAVISLSDFAAYMLPAHMDHVYDAVWTSSDTVFTWSQDFYWRQFQIAARPMPTTPITAEAVSTSSASVGTTNGDTNSPRPSTPSTPPLARATSAHAGVQHSTNDQQNDTHVSSAATSVPVPSPAVPPLVSPQLVGFAIPQPPPLPTHVMSSTSTLGSGTPAVQFAIEPSAYKVPAPRTAGARFCPAGFLVSLHRLYELKQKPNDRALADFQRATTSHATFGRSRSHRPRHTSLSRGSETNMPGGGFTAAGPHTAGVLVGAVSPGSAGTALNANSSSTGVTGGSSSASSNMSSTDHSRQHTVLIYSVNTLLKCSRELAVECHLDWTNPGKCCRDNAEIAMAFNRPDLAQAFNVASLVLDSTVSLKKPDLVDYIGRSALVRMFSHYIRQGCLQDAAMLAFFLAYTGIDLNVLPDSFFLHDEQDVSSTTNNNSSSNNSHVLNEVMFYQGARTPPLDSSHLSHQPVVAGAVVSHNSVAGTMSGDSQINSDGNVVYDHSYYTVGPSFLRRPAILRIPRTESMAAVKELRSPSFAINDEISTVKRSSSWHDVQNAENNGHPDELGCRERPYSNVDMSPSRSGNRYNKKSNSRENLFPFVGYTEAERLQMSVVLRCYADQLHAWRLYDRRTAILRPLNAVMAGQLMPHESTAILNNNNNILPMPKLVPRHSSSTTLVQNSGRNAVFQQQVSVDSHAPSSSATLVPSSSLTAANGSAPCSLPQCSVCERPVRGLSSVCLVCGHGGHTLHIRQFFLANYNAANNRPLCCPTGCGCRCLILRGPTSVS